MKAYCRCAYILCLGILLHGCSQAPEKVVHNRYTVEIKGMKFNPAELMVQTGDTVVWINHDLVLHNITDETNHAWASPPIPDGQSWTMLVKGSADYYCSLHVVMKGKLIVQ